MVFGSLEEQCRTGGSCISVDVGLSPDGSEIVVPNLPSGIITDYSFGSINNWIESANSVFSTPFNDTSLDLLRILLQYSPPISILEVRLNGGHIGFQGLAVINSHDKPDLKIKILVAKKIEEASKYLRLVQRNLLPVGREADVGLAFQIGETYESSILSAAGEAVPRTLTVSNITDASILVYWPSGLIRDQNSGGLASLVITPYFMPIPIVTGVLTLGTNYAVGENERIDPRIIASAGKDGWKQVAERL